MRNIITLDETIPWTIGGKDYDLLKPSIGLIADFSDKFNEAKGDAKLQMECTVGLLEKCGLPREVCTRLNGEQLGAVSDSLIAKKKD